jgi:predicted RNA binding protein YcfA (HicA-like mRNA interferase family)
MSYPSHIWNQLKGITAAELCRALQKDGWTVDFRKGAERVYRAPDGRRVSIHYHPHKTYGSNLLKALLADIGWTQKDMKRLKLIR